MAGLSMGSRQTLEITLANLDKFAWIGAFSGRMENFDIKKSYGGGFSDVAGFNQKVRLLYFSAGTAETRVHDAFKAACEMLQKAGYKNVVFVDFPKTAHEWQTWRKALHDFAPRLFK